MVNNQQQVSSQPVGSGDPSGGRTVPRPFGLVLLAEAATLGIASYLHRDGRIPLGFTVIHGEHFAGASIPEAVIGVVLAAGSATVLWSPARARRTALVATGFAIFGFIVGMVFVLTSGRPDITVDLTYHAVLLTALFATLVVLVLGRFPSAPGPVPESQRVRSR